MQDIWALGATFYALTYQQLPFYGAHDSETQELIVNKELEFPETSNFPVKDSQKEMLSMMLEKDPSQRATLEQLKKHQWINEGFTVSLTQEASK